MWVVEGAPTLGFGRWHEAEANLVLNFFSLFFLFHSPNFPRGAKCVAMRGSRQEIKYGGSKGIVEISRNNRKFKSGVCCYLRSFSVSIICMGGGTGSSAMGASSTGWCMYDVILSMFIGLS